MPAAFTSAAPSPEGGPDASPRGGPPNRFIATEPLLSFLTSARALNRRSDARGAASLPLPFLVEVLDSSLIMSDAVRKLLVFRFYLRPQRLGQILERNYDTSSRTSTRSETRERGLAHVAGVS